MKVISLKIEAKDYDNAELSGCQAIINGLSNEAKDLILHLANGEKQVLIMNFLLRK